MILRTTIILARENDPELGGIVLINIPSKRQRLWCYTVQTLHSVVYNHSTNHSVHPHSGQRPLAELVYVLYYF